MICSGEDIDVNFLINTYWDTQLIVVFTNRGPFAHIVRGRQVVGMYTIDGEAKTKTHCNLRLRSTNIGSNAMEVSDYLCPLGPFPCLSPPSSADPSLPTSGRHHR